MNDFYLFILGLCKAFVLVIALLSMLSAFGTLTGITHKMDATTAEKFSYVAAIKAIVSVLFLFFYIILFRYIIV